MCPSLELIQHQKLDGHLSQISDSKTQVEVSTDTFPHPNLDKSQNRTTQQSPTIHGNGPVPWLHVWDRWDGRRWREGVIMNWTPSFPGQMEKL